MTEPYLGEVRLFGGGFTPANWADCNGQLLQISDNSALFNLIGTVYGGDGNTTFAVPDLRSRVPVCQGTLPGGGTYVIGEIGGSEQVALLTGQLPAHSHNVSVASTAQTASPANAIMATAQSNQPGVRIYSTNPATTSLLSSSVGFAGGNQPHTNIQPYLAIRYIISLNGSYPSRA